MLLGGELYNAPIKSSPQNILDLGTGTGIWAMDIAEYAKSSILPLSIRARLTPGDRKFPTAHVIGNDISPIQPSWVAPNIEFIMEDFENEWDYPLNHFDFIHARCLAGYVSTIGRPSTETRVTL
jgi:SAM-dependent methyltransferase